MPFGRRGQPLLLWQARPCLLVANRVYSGPAMRALLTSPNRRRAFNGVIAALLVASLLPILAR